MCINVRVTPLDPAPKEIPPNSSRLNPKKFPRQAPTHIV